MESAPADREPAPPATRWVLRTRTLDLNRVARLPLLMGIVNCTPDSFSDGGRYGEPAAAIDHALALVAQGADFLDIGGESTRPYSTPVTTAEELRRVMPVVEGLAGRVSVPLSIDTSKAAVARAAIDAGVEIINDVTGLEGDAEMSVVARESRVGICAMHMRGSPQTMQDDPRYDDVLEEIFEYLRRRRDGLMAVGIDRERICLDPGIGFGKTHEHNLTLLRNCRRFHALGVPLLVGYSRKGFIGKLLGDPQRDRLAANVGIAAALALQRVQILRVHDVGAVRDALLLFEACGGLSAAAP
jgi:dihydropteroate synthase